MTHTKTVAFNAESTSASSASTDVPVNGARANSKGARAQVSESEAQQQVHDWTWCWKRSTEEPEGAVPQEPRPATISTARDTTQANVSSLFNGMRDTANAAESAEDLASHAVEVPTRKRARQG